MTNFQNKIKYLLIDTDADFDDLAGLQWSLLKQSKIIWRTIGNGYSSPKTAIISTGGTAAWAKQNKIRIVPVFIGSDIALCKTLDLDLYTKPPKQLLQFTADLSIAPEFKFYKQSIILYQNQVPEKYNANNESTIIALGPLTNLALDSKLWNSCNCPNVFISSSQLHTPITFPVFLSKESNVGIDPIATIKVFNRLTKFGKIPILINQQLELTAVISVLEKVLCQKIPKKNRIVAQRMLDTLVYAQKYDTIPPIHVWDLTATMVTFFPFLIETKILCRAFFDKDTGRILFSPVDNYTVGKHYSLAYLAIKINLDLTLELLEKTLSNC